MDPQVDDAIDNKSASSHETQVIQSLNPSPFESIPNEVLEHIFSFLDATSLKNSVLVESRWNEVISYSPKTMKTLPLTVRLHRPSNQEITQFSRRYEAVAFKDVKMKIPKYMAKELQRIGTQVKSLYFENCNFPKGFLKITNCFPKVTNVSVASLYGLISTSSVMLKSTTLPHLKSLRIHRVSNVS
jgi:hypothetical protein